mgnify:CR=1 FL=1
MSLFQDLLNVQSCEQLPDIAAHRRSLEEFFLNKAKVTPATFNKYMADLEIMLLDG